MCLAVPSKIVSIDENGMAQVSVLGVERACSLRLTPDAQVGDYVLVHAGFAIQRVEEQDARETLSLWPRCPTCSATSWPPTSGARPTPRRPDRKPGRRSPWS